LPNKRLKLAGGYRSTGTGASAPWRARAVVHYSCAGGRVARSLSAIRKAAAPGLEDWHGNTIAPPPSLGFDSGDASLAPARQSDVRRYCGGRSRRRVGRSCLACPRGQGPDRGELGRGGFDVSARGHEGEVDASSKEGSRVL